MLSRIEVLEKINPKSIYDIIIIGGGATGIGSALDSALRGYKTLLLEKADFTKGTSSRSTKLVHGGVRYLAQGDIFLVFEALRERGYLMKNAPHLVHDQTFIIPNYKLSDAIFYTIGLKFYDLLSGSLSLGKSVYVSKKKVRQLLPGIIHNRLIGGVLYHDAQFDDSRLAIDLLHSLFEKGGLAVNYLPVTSLLKDSNGMINGVVASDSLSGREYRIMAKAVINATGVWVDDIMQMDQPEKKAIVKPSQGVHLIFDKRFLPGNHALMIPKTSDGRVLFAVPWHDHLIVGTTDTSLSHTPEEPVPLEQEINFILETAGNYLSLKPSKADVLSAFAGLRPLAAPDDKESQKTKEISRNHKIIVSKSNLVTITGGKWTTYRRMAEQVVNRAAKVAGLVKRPCATKTFTISTCMEKDMEDQFAIYGCRRWEIVELVKNDPLLCSRLHPSFKYIKAEIIYICRTEMVVKLEDILARRLRALFLNARAAAEMAPMVAEIAGKELGWTREQINREIQDFIELAHKYQL